MELVAHGELGSSAPVMPSGATAAPASVPARDPAGVSARDSARDLANRALATLKDPAPKDGTMAEGTMAEGLALYRRALRAFEGHKLPLGLHAAMLRQAGRSDAAARIEEMGVIAGADLCLSAHAPGQTPARIVAEYQARFAQGQINATMISRYLLRLHLMGDRAAMRPWMDPALVRCIDLDGGSAGAVKAEDVAQEVRARLRPEHWQASSQSIAQSATFPCAPDGSAALAGLFTQIRAAVFAYAEDAGARVTGQLGWVPRSFVTRSWAVISRGDGYNHRHIHPQGWLTAVYYAACPDDAQLPTPDAGCLKIGGPTGIADDAPGWLTCTIRPVPGLLVLFPSWMTHWTLPLGIPAERISLPLDINPAAFRDTGYVGGEVWCRPAAAPGDTAAQSPRAQRQI